MKKFFKESNSKDEANQMKYILPDVRVLRKV